MRKTAMVEDAVKPAGHYSHAVISNGLVFVSGQGPVDPETGDMSSSFSGQVRQTMRNLDIILRGVGTELKHAVKINAYLSDLANFAEFNRVYSEFFPGEPPARTTVGCQLLDIMVEIDCVADLAPK
ncbi:MULTISPECIES: RidA family protein [unclassified Mesorhizobium]|uniref:RidA family protein n=1 Tax=unclassified Mesorhizobium TaxID=325217 RepID=UPI000B2B7AB4|nr:MULTISPECIES: RidA family protein [unclassified Mesorhizobium]MBN9257829.1 RidA family protein [Mesorhizobium sp.]